VVDALVTMVFVQAVVVVVVLLRSVFVVFAGDEANKTQ
jgi:hypothetical protein